jgi:hypothetical protein
MQAQALAQIFPVYSVQYNLFTFVTENASRRPVVVPARLPIQVFEHFSWPSRDCGVFHVLTASKSSDEFEKERWLLQGFKYRLEFVTHGFVLHVRTSFDCALRVRPPEVPDQQ